MYSIPVYYITQKKANRTPIHFFVDQEGIEPSSKRGKKMLSTCLSLPKIQPRHRKEQLNHNLSSKNSSEARGRRRLFPICRTTLSVRFGTTASG